MLKEAFPRKGKTQKPHTHKNGQNLYLKNVSYCTPARVIISTFKRLTEKISAPPKIEKWLIFIMLNKLIKINMKKTAYLREKKRARDMNRQFT